MEIIEQIIQILLIAWFLTQIGPMIRDVKSNFNFWKLFGMLSSCYKCMAFWVGLTISHNLYIAIGCSIIGYLLSKYVFTSRFKL